VTGHVTPNCFDEMTLPTYLSPLGVVDLLPAMRSIVQCKSGEGLWSLERAASPHPAPRADLSPLGRGENAPHNL
jgi:hypothetical protein